MAPAPPAPVVSLAERPCAVVVATALVGRPLATKAALAGARRQPEPRAPVAAAGPADAQPRPRMVVVE